MKRILNVTRLYTMNRWMILTPVLILFGSFAFVLLLMVVIRRAAGGPLPETAGTTGAVTSVLGYLAAVAMVAGTRMFPFSFSLGLTRRTFFFGTVIAGTLTSIVTAVVLGFGAWLETVTDRWGGLARYFNPFAFAGANAGDMFVVYLGLTMFLLSVSFIFCLVFKRWGLPGVLSSIIGILLILGALLMWMILAHAVPSVIGWLDAQPFWAFGLYALVAAVVLSALSASMIRKAVP